MPRKWGRMTFDTYRVRREKRLEDSTIGIGNEEKKCEQPHAGGV
jgi:hypothetical protein